MNPGVPVICTASTITRGCFAAERPPPPVPPGEPGPKTRERRNSSARVPSSTDEARISLTAVGFHTSTHVTEPSSRLSEKIRSNFEPSDFWTVRCWALLTSFDTRFEVRGANPDRVEADELSREAQDIGRRGAGREIVGLACPASTDHRPGP